MLNIHHAVSSMAKYDREVRDSFGDEVNATAVIGKMEGKGAAIPSDNIQGLHSELTRLFRERRTDGEAQAAITKRCATSDNRQCTEYRAFGELIVGVFMDTGVKFYGDRWW